MIEELGIQALRRMGLVPGVDDAYMCYRYLPEQPGAMSWIDEDEMNGRKTAAEVEMRNKALDAVLKAQQTQQTQQTQFEPFLTAMHQQVWSDWMTRQEAECKAQVWFNRGIGLAVGFVWILILWSMFQ